MQHIKNKTDNTPDTDKPLPIEIISCTFNRNGSSAAPSFICALFTHIEYPKEKFIATWGNKENDECMVDNDSIRVTNLSRPESSYRGDYFTNDLSKSIQAYCSKLNLSEISISAACFPLMHIKSATT